MAAVVVGSFALTTAEDANGTEDGNEDYDGEDGEGKEEHCNQRRTRVSTGKQRRSTQPLVT